MEIWLIYAIISAISAGFYAFMAKVMAERKYNISLAMIYAYFLSAILSGVYYFYFKQGAFVNWKLVLYLAIGNSLFYFISTVARVKGLKHIDTVIFFPIYKVIGPVLITIISFFYFSENLNIKEGLGILIGIFIPLLLITQTEQLIQKNLKKGIIFIIITAICTSISSFFSKQVLTNDLNVESYVFISMLAGIFFSFISYKFIQKNNSHDNKKGLVFFASILAITHLISFLTFTKALIGNLAVVYTVNSFSILVVVILAIFFYKEHFSFKKGIVIILSIISILLFI